MVQAHTSEKDEKGIGFRLKNANKFYNLKLRMRHESTRVVNLRDINSVQKDEKVKPNQLTTL